MTDAATTLQWFGQQERRRAKPAPRTVDFQDTAQSLHAAAESAFLRAMLAKSCINQTTSDLDSCSMVGSAFIAHGVIGERGKASAERNQQITRRLAELDGILYEDSGVHLNTAAKNAFITFMRANPRLTTPSLTADTGGELIAVWRKDDESISLKFFEATKFHYALAIKNLGKLVRPYGTANAAELLVKHPETYRIAT